MNLTVQSLPEVAAFFDVSISTVNRWRAMADPMPGEPGRWHLGQIQMWLMTLGPHKNDDYRDSILRQRVYGETWPDSLPTQPGDDQATAAVTGN